MRIPSPYCSAWALNNKEFSRHCLVLTQQERVVPDASVPGSKRAPATDAATSTGTLQQVTKFQEYHNTIPEIIKCVVVFAHKHTQAHVIRRSMKKDE
jgi:hypothetical protein